jgi:hypothetical protein
MRQLLAGSGDAEQAVRLENMLAALYKLLIPESHQGTDCLILANDEGQAADDLSLAKKLVAYNPDLGAEVDFKHAARANEM